MLFWVAVTSLSVRVYFEPSLTRKQQKKRFSNNYSSCWQTFTCSFFISCHLISDWSACLADEHLSWHVDQCNRDRDAGVSLPLVSIVLKPNHNRACNRTLESRSFRRTYAVKTRGMILSSDLYILNAIWKKKSWSVTWWRCALNSWTKVHIVEVILSYKFIFSW